LNRNSAKYKELSGQLANWWQTQTDFKTKKALAGFLKVHPDTIGDYFSGRRFPRSDIANRLYELTNIGSLKTNFDSASPPNKALKQSSPRPIHQHPTDTAYSIKESRESDSTRSSDHLKEALNLGGISEKEKGQPTVEIPQKEDRYGERSVVISLQRTACPFCGPNCP